MVENCEWHYSKKLARDGEMGNEDEEHGCESRQNGSWFYGVC